MGEMDFGVRMDLEILMEEDVFEMNLEGSQVGMVWREGSVGGKHVIGEK